MCSMCADTSLEQVGLSLRQIIERYGWAIQCVEVEPGESPWAYTTA